LIIKIINLEKDDNYMNKNSILLKLNKREFRLNKIIADRIDKTPKDKKINIHQNVECTILKMTKENLSVKVNTRVFVDPEALFSMEIEHVIEVTFREEITNEEIENNISEIIAPLGTEISYIIASVTKKMFGMHLILPPGIKVDKVNKLAKQ
jgi:flagellar basal body P-ring protein FlgI